MTFTEVTVTPEMAKDWLTRNLANNRNEYPSQVEKIADDIREGRWKLTHECIAFAGTKEKGSLIDGQHRLRAVVASNTSATFIIAEHCDVETFGVIGIGRARSTADLFTIEYKRKHGDSPKNATYLTSIAIAMLRGITTFKPKREKAASFTMKHLKLISRLHATFAKQHAIVGTPIVAAFANAVLYFGAEHVDPLIERMATELWSGRGDPLKALNARLVRAKTSETRDARLTLMDRYAITVSAIRAALEGEDREKTEPTTHNFGDNERDTRIKGMLAKKSKPREKANA
jgi:hypothetical protein